MRALLPQPGNFPAVLAGDWLVRPVLGCFCSCSSLDQHALESFLQQQRCILRCDCHSSLVWICLADYTDREFGVWGRGNGRYGFSIGGQDGAVSSGDNCRDSRPQLLSVVPFLGWTVERADMASCELLDA